MKEERSYPMSFLSEFKHHIDTARALHSAACELLARRPKLDPDLVMGRAAGGTVLEALAIELVLKERMARAGKNAMKTHRHDQLFKRLSLSEQENLRGRYASAPSDHFSSTLDDALAQSSELFEVWRYAHESYLRDRSPVHADIQEFLFVFDVLQEGL